MTAVADPAALAMPAAAGPVARPHRASARTVTAGAGSGVGPDAATTAAPRPVDVGRAPTMRPYQLAAVEAVRDRYRAGDRSTLVVLPTGTGKTVVFAEVARRAVAKGGRVLVLAHRGELLQQAAGKLAAVGVSAALEQGRHRADLEAPVVLASVATMRPPRLHRWPADAFRLIVIDEAHHATADSYRAILDYFAAARVLGVTATPDRADGASLGAVFASVAYTYGLADAIRAGYLAPIRALRVRVDGLQLDSVTTTAGDLDRGELAEVMRAPAVVLASARAMIEAIGARPCVAFTVDVAHAHDLADAINAARPGMARAVSGQSSEDERRSAAADLASGGVQVVCNAALWTEGFDCPTVAAVAIVRPTKSRALYAQMIGRGTRTATGKLDCLVVDVVGATRRHRLATAADIIAPGLPDEIAELVAAGLDRGNGADVMDAIDTARAAAEQREAEAVARWICEDVGDLLAAELQGDDAGPTDDGRPATADQIAAMERAGLEAPAGVTFAQARRVLDLLTARRRRGLATPRQVRALRRFGAPPSHAAAVSFEGASAEIAAEIARRRARSITTPHNATPERSP